MTGEPDPRAERRRSRAGPAWVALAAVVLLALIVFRAIPLRGTPSEPGPQRPPAQGPPQPTPAPVAKQHFASLLPEHTLAYVCLRDLAELDRRLEGTALRSIYREMEQAGDLERMLRFLRWQFGKLGWRMAELADVMKGEVSVAVPSLFAIHIPRARGGQKTYLGLNVAIGVELPEQDRLRAQAMVRRSEQHLKENNPFLTWKTWTVNDASLSQISGRIPGLVLPEESVCYGFVGRYFVCTIGKGETLIEEIAKRHRRKGLATRPVINVLRNGPTLADHKFYQAATAKRREQDALAWIYVSSRSLQEAAEALPEIDWLGNEAEALGVQDLDWLVWTWSVKGRGIREMLHVQGRRPLSGLWGLLARPESVDGRRDPFALAPKNATLAAVLNLPMDRLWQEVLHLTDVFSGRKAGRFRRDVQAIERTAGLKIGRDLFGQMRPWAFIFSTPIESETFTGGLSISFDLRDDQKMWQGLQQLALVMGAQGKLRVRPGRREGINFLQIDLFPGIAPICGVHNQRATLAVWIQEMMRILKDEPAPNGGLKASEAFREVVQHLPEKWDSLAYADWRKNRLLLPERYPAEPLFPAAVCAVGKGSSLELHAYTPVSFGAMLVESWAGSAAHAWRWVTKRECLQQLALVRDALVQSYPDVPQPLERLADHVRKRSRRRQLQFLVCPAAVEPDPGKPLAGAGYICAADRFGVTVKQVPPTMMLLWDRAPYHFGERGVVFANGRVALLTQARWRRQWARLEQALAPKPPEK